ncbi:MAG: ABC transporter permease [Bacillota bacterium]
MKLKRILNIFSKIIKTPEGFLSLSIIFVLLVLAIFGTWLTPYSPIKLNLRERFSSPTEKYYFGTDQAGRDIFSRVISGTKVSIFAGLLIVFLATIIGVPLGLIGGYYGGYIDTIITGITDMFLGFPPLVLAVAVSAALGPGIFNGVLAVSIVWWPGYVRLTRSKVLATKNLPYIEAARAAGAGNLYIIVKHILPACVNSIVVKQTMDIGYGILFVASLGFLGLGAQPPTPEWGTMISQGRSYIMNNWWLGFFPGLMITISVLAFNLFGDILQNVLFDSTIQE